MTRRQFILVFFLMAIPARKWEAQHEAPWLRGVAAVYRMLSETETVSKDNLDKPYGSTGKAHFAGVTLKASAPRLRLSQNSFAELARRNPMAGMTQDDRNQLDHNLWTYINSEDSEGLLKHLDRQWGAEGKCRSRSVEKDYIHVERCNKCRSVYNAMTRNDTTLRCRSNRIGSLPIDVDVLSTITP